MAIEQPQRYQAGERLPAVLFLVDLAALLRLTYKHVSLLAGRGAFDHLELPRIDRRPRYSGKKVQAWIDGETSLAPRSQFFRKAQR